MKLTKSIVAGSELIFKGDFADYKVVNNDGENATLVKLVATEDGNTTEEATDLVLTKDNEKFFRLKLDTVPVVEPEATFENGAFSVYGEKIPTGIYAINQLIATVPGIVLLRTDNAIVGYNPLTDKFYEELSVDKDAKVTVTRFGEDEKLIIISVRRIITEDIIDDNGNKLIDSDGTVKQQQRVVDDASYLFTGNKLIEARRVKELYEDEEEYVDNGSAFITNALITEFKLLEFGDKKTLVCISEPNVNVNSEGIIEETADATRKYFFYAVADGYLKFSTSCTVDGAVKKIIPSTAISGNGRTKVNFSVITDKEFFYTNVGFPHVHVKDPSIAQQLENYPIFIEGNPRGETVEYVFGSEDYKTITLVERKTSDRGTLYSIS